MKTSGAHHQEASGVDTRRRLIEAAGEVFAERGFRAATIREIVERAGANIAAVNYHFGDKENLYLAVVEHVCQGAPDRFPHLEALETPEARLREFVRLFLVHCLAADSRSWPPRLFAREMAEPTPAFQILVDRVMRPATERLVRIVKELGGDGLSHDDAWLCAQSVVAQCAYQKHAEAIIRRLGPPLPQGLDGLDQLVSHITRYSLAAIRHYLDLSATQPCQGMQPPSESGALHR